MTLQRKTATDTSASSFQLVEETALDAGDTHLIMTREEFEGIDPQFRRRLAAAANTDAINGKSTALEIRSYLCRQKSLSEYAES
jgi:hypothetical protein